MSTYRWGIQDRTDPFNKTYPADLTVVNPSPALIEANALGMVMVRASASAYCWDIRTPLPPDPHRIVVFTYIDNVLQNDTMGYTMSKANLDSVLALFKADVLAVLPVSQPGHKHGHK